MPFQKFEYKNSNRLRFLNLFLRNRHIRNVHRQKKYKCNYCDKVYSTVSGRSKHEKKNCEENLYRESWAMQTKFYLCHFCDHESAIFSTVRERSDHEKRCRLNRHHGLSWTQVKKQGLL